MTHQLLEDSDSTPTPPPHELPYASSRPARSRKSIRVLLVEDNPGDAELLQQYLEAAPEQHAIEVVWASRLLDGQARLARQRFDVIVADLGLPDSQGLSTFHRLRDQAPNTPVVVLTGHGDGALALQAMQQGAEDYLIKGDCGPNLLVRSLLHAIERTRRRRAERALRDTDAKMQAARNIQQRLFPSKAPRFPPGLRLAGRNVAYDLGGISFPVDAMGGDYFDYVPMRHGALGLVMGDVSGHGYGPALLMVETRSQFRALAQSFDDIGAIMTMTNRALSADLDDDRYITLFFGKLDIISGRLSHVNAGHPTGYVLDRTGMVKHCLESSTQPLGVAADSVFTTSAPLELDPGDLLLLLTDGITEATGPDNTPFGVERTLATVRHYLNDPARRIVDNLYHAVRAYTRNAVQVDDITALVLKVVDLDAEQNPVPGRGDTHY